MTYVPMFPKPKDIRRTQSAVFVMSDGRERCNTMTMEGREEYERRKRQMWQRQGHICCLKGHIVSCPGNLEWEDCTFDHEVPRGMDSANRDDRIEVEVKLNGKIRTLWQNGAAHGRCNSLKGSRRIKYNAAHNEIATGAKINSDAQTNQIKVLPQRAPDGRRKPPVAHPLRSRDAGKDRSA